MLHSKAQADSVRKDFISPGLIVIGCNSRLLSLNRLKLLLQFYCSSKDTLLDQDKSESGLLSSELYRVFKVEQN